LEQMSSTIYDMERSWGLDKGTWNLYNVFKTLTLHFLGYHVSCNPNMGSIIVMAQTNQSITIGTEGSNIYLWMNH